MMRTQSFYDDKLSLTARLKGEGLYQITVYCPFCGYAKEMGVPPDGNADWVGLWESVCPTCGLHSEGEAEQDGCPVLRKTGERFTEWITSGVWMDDLGRFHFDLPMLLRALGLPDDSGSRKDAVEYVRATLERIRSSAKRVVVEKEAHRPDQFLVYWRAAGG